MLQVLNGDFFICLWIWFDNRSWKLINISFDKLVRDKMSSIDLEKLYRIEQLQNRNWTSITIDNIANKVYCAKVQFKMV